MCRQDAVELGRGLRRIGVSLMTNPCASRRFAVQERGRQGDELRALESPNRAGHRDKLLSFVEFPIASAIGFRRR
jgi:hypothetical protein